MTNGIRLLTCVVLACAFATGESGEKKTREIEGWGAVVDPDGDCTIHEKSGKVSITVPNKTHDLNPLIRTNSPRVLRNVEGDFVTSVRVTGDFMPGEQSTTGVTYPFNGAGLLLWKDNQTFIRLERNIWWNYDTKQFGYYPPLLECYLDGKDQDTNPPITMNEFFKGRSTHLRLERKANQVTASYSHDGKEWTVVKTITADLPARLQVGVAAVNSSNREFTVEFDQFKVEASK